MVIKDIERIVNDYSEEDVELHPQDNLAELGMQSLEMIEIAERIGEACDMEIPDEDLPDLVIVQDLLDYIEKHAGSRA